MNRFRKHLRPIGVGVSVAALAVGSTTLASASSSKAGAPQSITVTLYYTGLTNVDTDRNHKPSVGDIGVAPGFYVDSTGKRIGSAVSNCTQINAVGSLYTCRTASKFPSGEVFAEDRFDATKRTVGGRILGGSGAYSGATGTLAGRWLKPDYTQWRLTFRFGQSPAAKIAGLRKQLEAVSPAGIARQLARTKAALDKYQSVDRAKADGYAPASPCEFLPSGMGGESSHSGGMGVHFVSGAAMADGKLDPTKPEILVYAPGSSGFQLVAAEYFKPAADQSMKSDADRPTLFGRAFDGPMAGHAPGMPAHYDLHVWLWKKNVSGIFAPWNPGVTCG